MKKAVAAAVMAAGMAVPATLWAWQPVEAIEVRVVTDDGGVVPTYPARSCGTVRKFYAEATKGDHYTIEVVNRLGTRVGLVVAVDGRNIISGQKSWLKSTERMYILEPYGRGEFSGWRTSLDRINRFYFTDVPDSYAAAFGDESAMGVIAVAAYPEIVRRAYIQPMPVPQAEAKGAGSRMEKAMDSAGTGFGREEYSPAQVVEFEPQKSPAAKVLIKYEWRQTLCALGVASCGRKAIQPQNRLWESDGFAPYPPGRP